MSNHVQNFYKNLLAKYMAHVLWCNSITDSSVLIVGSNYIEHILLEKSPIEFTGEELRAFKELQEEGE